MKDYILLTSIAILLLIMVLKLDHIQYKLGILEEYMQNLHDSHLTICN